MKINLSSKRSKLIILIVFFVVFAGAGGYLLWRVNQPETVAPEDMEAAGEDRCESLTLIPKLTPKERLKVDDKLTMTIKTKDGYKANEFFVVIYNRNKDYSNPDDPDPVCVKGGVTDPQGRCPSGTGFLVFNFPGDSPREEAKMTVDVLDIFVKDEYWDGKQLTKVQINAYVKKSGGDPSLPVVPCARQANLEEAETFTVKYDANNGTCKPSECEVSSGGECPAPSCTRSGYNLTEFTRTSGSGGTLNTLTGAVTNVTGNQTIMANWKQLAPNQYIVTYNANGGTCIPSSRTVESGKDADAPSCTRLGYDLTGFTRTSGSGGTLNALTGAVTEVTGDQTITANWEQLVLNQYIVTYNGNGGTCTPGSRTVESGKDADAPSCTRSGYNLTGFTRTSGSGGILNSSTGAVSNVTGNQTITANWEEIFLEGSDPEPPEPDPGPELGLGSDPDRDSGQELEPGPVVSQTVPETGIFDDSQTAILTGLALLFLGFTWRWLGRGMYISIEFLGKIPKKISIGMKDIKEDIHAKKRVKLLKQSKKRKQKFEKKVVKD